MNRTDVINHLIKKYDYKSYLEIGIKNPKSNFDLVSVEDKDGVDPEWRYDPATGNKFVMTSDEYFMKFNKSYDLIFIDGLHYSKQLDRDIINSLACLKENGTIVVHDCNPATEKLQSNPPRGTGDCWKSIFKLRCFDPNLSIFVVDIGHGCGVIRKGQQELYKTNGEIEDCLNWEYFDRNRKEMLNLVSFEEMVREGDLSKVQTDEPLISIAMACYNAEYHIRDAIKSIITQDYPNWELVIVDDKSKDNSLRAIDQCIREFNIADKAKVFKHDVNCGYGCTLKDACEKSTGELVAIVDSDDALANNKALRVVVAAHKKHPKASMTYSNYIFCDQRLNPIRPIRTRQLGPKENYFRNRIRISHLKAFKRASYDKTEGVNPNIRRTIDKDIVLKLEEVGKLVHINMELYRFRHHPAQLGSTFPKREGQRIRRDIYRVAEQRRRSAGRKDLL
jgi:hypothetical protein